MPETDLKPAKIVISHEELRRLKLAKKEAKKKQNAKPQAEQELPPKVLERRFTSVPDQPIIKDKLGDLRVMTFNVMCAMQNDCSVLT
jgi:hypothetical protein